MQRIVFILTITAALLDASSAAARIGETEAQLEQRFGNPFNSRAYPEGQLLFFRKGDIEIGVVMQSSKSAAEFYSHRDKSPLSESEIQLLLQANANGGTWEEDPNGKLLHQKVWFLRPGGSMATMGRYSLAITAAGFTQKSAANRAKADREKLKDF